MSRIPFRFLAQLAILAIWCVGSRAMAVDVTTVTLSGTVVDYATSKPLAGIRLEFYNGHGRRETLVTDLRGRFHVKVARFESAEIQLCPAVNGEYLVDWK
jgi:hypothetical protein